MVDTVVVRFAAIGTELAVFVTFGTTSPGRYALALAAGRTRTETSTTIDTARALVSIYFTGIENGESAMVARFQPLAG